MFRALCVLSIGLALSSSSLASDRTSNSASKISKFPRSKDAKLEKKLTTLAKEQDAFSDKEILRVSLVQPFGPETRDENFVLTRYASAAIAVFDSQNNKCWAWNEVVFKKQSDGQVWYDSANLHWVNEIDCAKVR